MESFDPDWRQLLERGDGVKDFKLIFLGNFGEELSLKGRRLDRVYGRAG